jgi:rhomboid protease GluP
MFTRSESFREFIRFYPVVSIIIAIQIIFYLLTIPLFPNRVMESFMGVNLFILEGEIWRLLTPLFLHGGFTHLLFNSFSIILFGPALEKMIGRGKFLLLYFVSGITANVATLLLQPPTYSHVGSSGAIFGLFGFYIAIILFRKSWMSQSNSQIIITLSVISLIMTFFQPNVNITAHLFGFLAGLLIGTLSLKKN